MSEQILYFDWYADDNKFYSIEYAGVDDDLAVLETDNYIVYLTMIGDTIIRNKDNKFKIYEEFPSDLKKMISQCGIQERYGNYTLLDNSFYNYCISKKVDDEEEFLCCLNTFSKLDSMELEKDKMYKVLLQYLNESNPSL